MLTTPKADLVFDGQDDYVEIPDDFQFSVPTTGQLSVAAWMRPDALNFPVFQSTIGTRDLESFFLGAIREVRIWNRALATAEVGALYSGLVPQEGLVAEYLLSQDIAVDSTGLKNGVIVGATWTAS